MPRCQEIVAIHAFTEEPNGDQEYADWNPDDPSLKWTIYRRWETPDDPQQPFDTEEVGDFDNFEDAWLAAESLARRLGVPLQEY